MAKADSLTQEHSAIENRKLEKYVRIMSLENSHWQLRLVAGKRKHRLPAGEIH